MSALIAFTPEAWREIVRRDLHKLLLDAAARSRNDATRLLSAYNVPFIINDGDKSHERSL